MTDRYTGTGSREDVPVDWPRRVHLTAGSTSIIVGLPPHTLPTILYWGTRLHGIDASGLSAIDALSEPVLPWSGGDREGAISVVPEAWTGWTGTPGLSGHRAGAAWAPRFAPHEVTVRNDGDDGGSVTVRASDALTELELEVELALGVAGLLTLRAAVRNTGTDAYTLERLDVALPVPAEASELLDLAGRWARERIPQRQPFTVGTHLRESRRGRTGPDAATVLVAGEPGFDFGHGRVWGVHVGFSGNHRVCAERSFSSDQLLYAGETLLPGEIILGPGERYATPTVYAARGDGLDQLAATFHEFLRARPQHPRTPRPVVMNVWEAVYFDHDLDRITELATLAAGIGVERFVLDDGWFGARSSDRAGLGDWYPREEVWGDGRFGRLVAHVKGLGMQFGLWFEPEMVNLDSDLARAHPDWLLQVPGRLPVEARHQQVLDLTHPEAFDHIKASIVSLVRRYGIAFIKWDHNRDLVDAGSTRTGRAGVHAQTLAVYRLIDEIKDACPGLEIESCSSGGGRVDLGILERTERVWASDCIDAHERQQIQRWTAQLIPLELIGSHVGAARAHTTGRVLDLSFRAVTALFGHFGIEWDLSTASPEEIGELRAWVDLYKRFRPLLHRGSLVRRDSADSAVALTGVVSPERHEALYAISVLQRTVTWPAGRLSLPGLDPERHYLVRVANPGSDPAEDSPRVYPAWWTTGLTATGEVLEHVGIQVPALHPDHAALVHVTDATAEFSSRAPHTQTDDATTLPESAPRLVARERTPTADPDVYGPALAYSLHLTAETNGEVEWFNGGSGTAFAESARVGDDIRETRTLRRPHVFRTASGWLAVSMLAGPTGEPLPREAGTALVHTSDDLLTWNELASVQLGTDVPVALWGTYDTVAEVAKLCWREADGTKRTATLAPDGTLDGSSIVAGWPAVPPVAGDVPPGCPLRRVELDRLRSISEARDTVPSGDREIESQFVPFIRDRADPCILRYRGEYLFVATDDTDGRNVRARGLLARRSPTVAGLRDAVDHQIMRLDEHTPPGCYWAPEFHELGGRLHCFFAMGVDGSAWTDVQCHVMTLRDGGDPLAADDWGRPRRVLHADGSPLQRDPEHPGISLDMTCFTIGDRTYVVWSQRYITDRAGDAELWISTIDPTRPDRLLVTPVRIASPEFGWETNDANVAEGPYALQHGGRVFLVYSAAGVSARYAVGLLDASASADLLDAASWRKRGHPLYRSDPETSEWGPGHNSFVVDNDTDELLFVYHAKTGVHDVGRHTALRRVLWDDAGAPVIGPWASAVLEARPEGESR